jgi:hypothetical protein
VNYVANYHKLNPYSNTYNSGWKDHLNLKWENKEATQNSAQSNPSHLEEALTQFIKLTQSNFEA